MNEGQMHRLFNATVLMKAVFAVLDVAAAGLLYFFGTNRGTELFVALARSELVEDSTEVTRFVLHGHHFPHIVVAFAIWYLLAHGMINAIFSFGLWKGKEWGYLFALSALSVFAVYQLYRITITLSPWLTLVTLVDLCVIWIIWREYQTRRAEWETDLTLIA